MKIYRGILASSQNPAELSLTVESVGKVLIGIIGWYAVSKGMDAATAQTQLQTIIDAIAQAAPIVFTLWSSMLVLWGLVRKLLATVGMKDPFATSTMTGNIGGLSTFHSASTYPPYVPPTA